MDRYVIRERRIGAGSSPTKQVPYSSPNIGGNNLIIQPENMFHGVYNPDIVNAQHAYNTGVVLQNNGQAVSGIDPRYLAAYSEPNASFISTGPNHLQIDPNIGTAGPAYSYGNYQNKNFVGAERSTPRKIHNLHQPIGKEQPKPFARKQMNSQGNTSSISINEENYQSSLGISNEQIKKSEDTAQVKNETQAQPVSRFDKLKALSRSGPRVFSGPVEKVLKWHKALQEVGILILYEIVAKCVSVRPGDSSAKILVVRDENGPALQVVYYEIDFLLPELKLPCTVRVIGRMMHGTCRLQAFHVRPATGDDVATLPRRAAVAQHHVTKLCKEYTNGNETKM